MLLWDAPLVAQYSVKTNFRHGHFKSSVGASIASRVRDDAPLVAQYGVKIIVRCSHLLEVSSYIEQ